jgi:hypothetical protein
MPCSSSGNRFVLSILAAFFFLVVGCSRNEPPAEPATPQPAVADTAAPPPAIPQHDPTAAPVERAAPPTLQPVVLGKFLAGNPVAESATGELTIEDGQIIGANGAKFTTERVALVSGDDQYAAGARYADTMMIEPRQQVELRHVVEETPPAKEPAQAFCGSLKTGYLALAKVMDGDTEVVKVLALSGQDLPAASATDVALCAAADYRSAE